VRAAVVSCHVERLLDDDVWARLRRLLDATPGGFRVAALVRPPDLEHGEDEQRWLERARSLDVPFGLHTHWTSPSHARPTGGDPAARVRRELAWLREHDLVDLTATTFALPYGGGRVVAGPEPGLLPATHTIGMLARAVRLPDYVHAYFHDTDLVERPRALALAFGLRHLALRRPVSDLDELRRASSR
jgi:hypothetical protein